MNLIIITYWFGEQTNIPPAPINFEENCKCFFFTDNKNLQVYIENQGWEYRYMSPDEYNAFRVKLCQFKDRSQVYEMDKYERKLVLTLEEVENIENLLILSKD